MNLQEIKSDLPIQCVENLKALYEMTCEEYRRCLCAKWDISLSDTFWVADKIGNGLAFPDFVLGIDEIRYCVDNDVTYERYAEYDEYLMNEAHDGQQLPRINFHSWFEFGARPEY